MKRGWVISQSNPFYQTWRFLNIIIVFISSFYFAYQSAFLNLEPEDNY